MTHDVAHIACVVNRLDGAVAQLASAVDRLVGAVDRLGGTLAPGLNTARAKSDLDVAAKLMRNAATDLRGKSST